MGGGPCDQLSARAELVPRPAPPVRCVGAVFAFAAGAAGVKGTAALFRIEAATLLADEDEEDEDDGVDDDDDDDEPPPAPCGVHDAFIATPS